MSHSLTIGILLPFLLGYNSSQAYYGPVLTGIYTAAQQRGVRLILVEKAWRSTQHMLVTERQHEHSWALAQTM
jgi:DNA-binding LacI/PurR family transcriptional regulator